MAVLSESLMKPSSSNVSHRRAFPSNNLWWNNPELAHSNEDTRTNKKDGACLMSTASTLI